MFFRNKFLFRQYSILEPVILTTGRRNLSLLSVVTM